MTFNHGVEGSSPSALTIQLTQHSDFLDRNLAARWQVVGNNPPLVGKLLFSRRSSACQKAERPTQFLAACEGSESRSACRGMSPRIIHIPLSGATERHRRRASAMPTVIHESAYRQSVLIRSAAEAKLREANQLECEAWNAIMWAGGPAMPSPGDPQAEPTIGKAINGGYDLLEAKCNRCNRVSLVSLRALRQPGEPRHISKLDTRGRY